ncbi:MAG: HNH endonuclease signature motif containing protein [Planctomycetota bacterium]
MKIVIRCQGCSVKLAAPASKAGKVLRCPKCNQHMTVPELVGEAKPASVRSSEGRGSRAAQAFEASTAMGFMSSLAKSAIEGIKVKKKKLDAQKEFTRLLVSYLVDGVLTDEEEAHLRDFCVDNELELGEAIKRSGPQVARFFHTVLLDVVSDRVVTEDEEAMLQRYVAFLRPPTALIQEIDETLGRVKELQAIREGIALQPLRKHSLLLKNGEIPWASCEALLIRELKRGIQKHGGTCYVTNQRVVFHSREHPKAISLKSLQSVEAHQGLLYVVGTSARSTASFYLREPERMEAFVEYAVRALRRQLDLKQTSGVSRSIPQHVKLAVWQRDLGRCVQCGAEDYLEFDHVIPFSKGGANSVENLQILCRRCNLEKGSKL